MAIFLKINIVRKLPHLARKSSYVQSRSINLTQHDVATALRPFYFAVHPDLFYQYPKEKEINENSLKQLNFYLETVLKNLPTNPISLTFCLRNGSGKVNNDVSFRQVNIKLLGKDLHCSLHNILSTCHLPTDDLNTLLKNKPKRKSAENATEFYVKRKSDAFHSSWWNEAQKAAKDIEERIRNEPDIDLRFWLNNNVEEALRRLRKCQPLRDETERLSKELIKSLKLKDVLWNCGWGISHFRGCLQSFRGLTVQHPSGMSVLTGRTIVFGRQTGVSFEGHIILSSEDVRNNWLDMIHSVHQYDDLLNEIPAVEKNLSEVLRGINVDHRKFQPTVMVQKYIQQLNKLTSALYKYRWVHGYPSAWPRRLENFQIVVECEAGPLMLSPTGQFIVPASCPAFLLVDFITRNLEAASSLLEQYDIMKTKELEMHMKCMSDFGLGSLEKDDNITPNLMIQCCERMLQNSSIFKSNLRDIRLRISHYYCILQDGEICIPWDWKSFN